MLTKKEFYKFINNYSPLSHEEFNETDDRFDLNKRYVNYALRNRDRFYCVLKYSMKYFSSKNLKILDLGTYPGTMLRILHEFLSEFSFDLYGAGLCLSQEFINIMKEKSNASIMTVNVDPKNHQLKGKNDPTRIPLEDASLDFIFSLDIIEHLQSPLDMLSEAQRVLKQKGKIVITTNNVSRIGSVFKLLVGKTNFDRLAPPDYYNEADEWRPHVREYAMEELENLLEKSGFKAVDEVFFNSNETYFNIRSFKQRVIDGLKLPFCCIPHFREHILIIGEKE